MIKFYRTSWLWLVSCGFDLWNKGTLFKSPDWFGRRLSRGDTYFSIGFVNHKLYLKPSYIRLEINVSILHLADETKPWLSHLTKAVVAFHVSCTHVHVHDHFLPNFNRDT